MSGPMGSGQSQSGIHAEIVGEELVSSGQYCWSPGAARAASDSLERRADDGRRAARLLGNRGEVGAHSATA